MRAFLGLGSNLGDRWAHLRTAVTSLPDVVGVSPVYETAPVGGPASQGPYLNCVVELDTARPPHDLLDLAQRLEAAAGR
ncbi:MAG: 2-amino-4-hydroxy-6-hydroxymethyldihydropteridine diphosphokinase, partial [Acidimicrobiia bacterium]|nr:2-amino-4-hydroxy-6-hydroxymethyldihydropteridine diphosphokinase [Acidimicrobiia bacterium]